VEAVCFFDVTRPEFPGDTAKRPQKSWQRFANAGRSTSGWRRTAPRPLGLLDAAVDQNAHNRDGRHQAGPLRIGFCTGFRRTSAGRHRITGEMVVASNVFDTAVSVHPMSLAERSCKRAQCTAPNGPRPFGKDWLACVASLSLTCGFSRKF